MDAWISHYRTLPTDGERDAFFNGLVSHYSELFDATGSGYVLLDADQRVIAWNDTTATLLGHQPVVGEAMPKPGDLFELEHRNADAGELIDASLASQEAQQAIWEVRREGESHWLRLTILPLTLVDRPQALVIFKDISAEKRLEADLQAQQAALDDARVRDPLTGLHNRRFILEHLDHLNAQAKRYGNTFSLALIDLDHFKSVNDTYGHQVADQVLCSLANLIRDDLREADVTARYGEEEFLVVLPETDIEAAVNVINRLRQRFTESRIPGIKRSLTLSAGVMSWEPGLSLEQLMFKTDQRLSMAKYAGRNQVCGEI
ncbi:sensor domain-containing diguanylate cyclase [Saccharospirillum mangrovi]|uniref:sensor domain-containing diguanylate cyclase n=1 Tax=Saccharospirillum mangrovi TaxID=2161747 RepID=UPI000D3A79AA|nr:sensor domain-containing diguanylate cyclase [Saccharospirillum mangrovi]